MRKVLLSSILSLFLGIGVACADNDRPITVNQLPAKAQQFIATYFSDQKVSFAKEEHDFLEVTYEVLFANSIKVEFAKNGEWKEVNCKYSVVPDGIVPAQIVTYVKSNFPDVRIVSIERGRRDIEVSLTNNLELTFDLDYNIIDIDD